MEREHELSAGELASQASALVKHAQETTALSLSELAVVFKIASLTCDESNAMYEAAQMRQKFRQWKPGK